MLDGVDTDPLLVKRKPDKVITVMIDNASAECVGKSFIRDIDVALKNLEGRLFEE